MDSSKPVYELYNYPQFVKYKYQKTMNFKCFASDGYHVLLDLLELVSILVVVVAFLQTHYVLLENEYAHVNFLFSVNFMFILHY